MKIQGMKSSFAPYYTTLFQENRKKRKRRKGGNNEREKQRRERGEWKLKRRETKLRSLALFPVVPSWHSSSVWSTESVSVTRPECGRHAMRTRRERGRERERGGGRERERERKGRPRLNEKPTPSLFASLSSSQQVFKRRRWLA